MRRIFSAFFSHQIKNTSSLFVPSTATACRGLSDFVSFARRNQIFPIFPSARKDVLYPVMIMEFLIRLKLLKKQI